MNEVNESPPPLPRVRRRRTIFSLVWFVPLVALVLGGWLVYKTRSEQGPLVTIRFSKAAGIEAGVTRIKYRDVSIGEVEAVRINEDFDGVIVTARLSRDALPFLNADTRFWIERPRIGAGGVSGLGTLFSGVHIGFESSPGRGEERDFVGLERPPLVEGSTNGIRVRLDSETVGSLVPGSPVYYRSFKVGTVEATRLDDDFNRVVVEAFVEAPYHQLVRESSRFWNVSGVSARITAEGISVSLQSIESLLLGGIAFDSPPGAETASAPDGDHVFHLFASEQDVGVESFAHKVFYMLNFDQSLRGLAVGAPVEYRGVRIGRVVNIGSRFDADTNRILLPVLIEVEPERLGMQIVETSASDAAHREMVALGMRARLQTANLLTGQSYVSIDFYEDAEPVVVERFEGYQQIPTISTDLNRITQNLEDVLEKINRMELESLVSGLIETLAGVRAFTGNTDTGLQRVLGSIEETLARSRDMMGSGKSAFEQGQQVMRGLDEDSPSRYQFDQMVKELRAAARSLRTLTETIEKNPNALIFGKPADNRTGRERVTD